MLEVIAKIDLEKESLDWSPVRGDGLLQLVIEGRMEG